MARNRRTETFSAKSLALIERVNDVIEDLHRFWPLTLRQIYYQLVAALVVDNNPRSYKNLSTLLTKARIHRLVDWDAMEDRSRSTLGSGGWSDRRHYVMTEGERFLADYRRDLLQSQPWGMEVWVEKDALAHICHEIAFPYCIDVVSAKGFTSTTYKHECAKRIERRGREGRPTKLFYLGDLDPSGWEMLPSMTRTMIEEMEVPADLLMPARVALNPEHVEVYDLPHSVDALKLTDSRADAYIERFGMVAVELDALRPDDLQGLLREAIENNLDLSAFERERDIQDDEVESLAELREEITKVLAGSV